MSDSVLGVDWFKNFVRFRGDPKALNSLKISPDALAMHILKDLYSDSIGAQQKVHLLLLFQEHSSVLLQDDLMLEKVISSFKGLYQSIEENVEKKLLRSQLLITSTTILLTWKNWNEYVSSLIVDFMVLLLEIILSEKKCHVVRTSACRCLEEIETCFPGILGDKLNVIYMAYRSLLIPSMQSFAILLSICLKHNTDFLLNSRKPWSVKNANIVLDDMPSSSSSFNTVHVHNILDCILDNVSYMSGTCFYIVFINLVHVIKNNKELLPTVFKSFVPKLIRSSDVLHFHLAFVFQKLFGLELLTSIEEKLLLQQLLISISHPCLTASHRLLYLDWLETSLMSQDGFISSIPNSNLSYLIPGPFDGPHMQEKKIRFLALYFQKQCLFDRCSDFLLNCLSGLKRQVTICKSMKISASFFRSIFILYSASKSTAVQLSINKLILDVVTVSPHLSTYVLDLITCFKSQNNESFVNTSLLTMLVDHLINLPPQKLECELQNFLPILEKAAVVAPSICKPEVTVRQLKKLLSMPNSCEAYKWVSGYYILLMCNTFMKLDDIDILYHGLGELLQLLMKNSKDIHIQVQAKQYYAALTSLPKARIKALCRSQPFNQHQTPLSFVDGKSPKFQSINVISKLSKPVLELIRLERNINHHQNYFHLEEDSDESDIMQSYKGFINSDNFHPVVEVPFLLKHVDDVPENFNSVYSVVIEVTPSSPCLKVSTIEVPMLTKANDGASINVEFIPSKPQPLSLYFKVKFTSSDGFSYSFKLSPVKLELPDLFLVLPISSPNLSERPIVKQLNFNDLWEHLLSQKDRCCVSTFRLEIMKTDISSLVEKLWKPFIMEQDCEKYRIGIFVPPSSHLLLKAEVVNEAGLITSLTDNCLILPHMSMYMSQIAINKM